MLKYKFKIGDSSINIPIGTSFNVADKDEAIRDVYVKDKLNDYIPPEEDYEISRYYPLNADEIVVRLFKEENVPFTFDDFGFTDDDIKFFYNRVENSYLNITFYTADNRLEQTAVYVTDLFVQRTNLFNPDQTVKKANEANVFFNIKNPKRFENETEGYFVYLKNNEYIPPFYLYSKFRFNNAGNGVSYVFYPQKNLFVNTVLETDEYVKANFSTNSFSFDTIGKTLAYSSNVLNIDLYALNI